MSEEKAIRTYGGIDDQFSNFVEPQDAIIKVTLESDVRLVGMQRLAALFEKFLKEEGYVSVQVTGLHGTNILEYPWPNKDLIERQKQVQIQIEVK